MHPAELWDFDDPAGSERRFRDAAAAAAGSERAVWMTQVARALGLQERYADASAVLDGIDDAEPEVAVRVALERGRIARSSDDPVAARPLFERAAALAERAGLDELRVDALHMVALVADAAEQVGLHEEALHVARRSKDPRARAWEASLLNNLGMTYADAGDFAAALPVFEQALAARERQGKEGPTRIARWMVAWALRNLGRTDDALRIQRALKAELDDAGEVDPYVDEELALLEG